MTFVIASLSVFSFAILRNELWALALPVGGVFAAIAVMRPWWVFALMLAVMPFSIEYNFNGWGTDLPSEPLVLILAALVVLYVLLRPHPHAPVYARTALIGMLVLHFAWVVVATIFSHEPLVSFKFLLSKSWYLLVFVGGAAIFLRSEGKLRQVFWLLHISVMVTIAVVMVRHAALGFSFDGINKACSVVYRNHVNYGVFIAMWLPWQWLALRWYNKGSVVRLFLVMSILLTLVSLYFSYTRGAWLAVVLIPVFWAVMRFRLMKWAFGGAAILLLLGSIYLYQHNQYLQYAPNFETTKYHSDFSEHMSATFSGEDMSTMERFHRWVGAVRMSADAPLTGFGPGNFSRYYQPYTVTAFSTYISDNEEMSTVHNYFLLVLTEQGIPGLIIFIVFTMLLFLTGQQVWHSQADAATRRIIMALMLCIFVFYVNNMFSDFFEANKLAPLFFICLAVLVNIRCGIWKAGAGSPT